MGGIKYMLHISPPSPPPRIYALACNAALNAYLYLTLQANLVNPQSLCFQVHRTNIDQTRSTEMSWTIVINQPVIDADIEAFTSVLQTYIDSLSGTLINNTHVYATCIYT